MSATRAKLDDLAKTVRREADTADAGPFDEAMVVAVVGAVKAMKAEAEALAEMQATAGRLARKL